MLHAATLTFARHVIFIDKFVDESSSICSLRSFGEGQFSIHAYIVGITGHNG